MAETIKVALIGIESHQKPLQKQGLQEVWLPQIEPICHQRYRDLFAAVDLVLCEGEHFARCLAALGCPERKLGARYLALLGTQADNSGTGNGRI